MEARFLERSASRELLVEKRNCRRVRLSTDGGLPMTFEVAFTRATSKAAFIHPSARSPTSGGLLDTKSRLVVQRFVMLVRQAIWCCNPSPGSWTWTWAPVLAPGPCSQTANAALSKPNFIMNSIIAINPCRRAGSRHNACRDWAPLTGAGSHSRRRRSIGLVTEVMRWDEKSIEGTSRQSQGLTV